MANTDEPDAVREPGGGNALLKDRNGGARRPGKEQTRAWILTRALYPDGDSEA